MALVSFSFTCQNQTCLEQKNHATVSTGLVFPLILSCTDLFQSKGTVSYLYGLGYNILHIKVSFSLRKILKLSAKIRKSLFILGMVLFSSRDEIFLHLIPG